MDEDFAIQLDNWFAEEDSLRIRKGSAEHATGLGGSVKTLVSHDAGTVKKLISCTDAKIRDLTGGADLLASGITDGQWSTSGFNGKTFFVNGADTPQTYDGSTVSSSDWTGTGLTPSDLLGVVAYRNRLFFWENNTQRFWYGGVDAVTGALSKFDLSTVTELHGNLKAMGVWTLDGGEGPDDVLAIFTQGGDVLLYRGGDPGSASNWTITGVYRIGGLVSDRGVMRFGSDLAVITDDGYVPLSRALPLGRGSDRISISNNIQNAVRDVVGQTKSNTAWQMLLHAPGGMIIVNVPEQDGSMSQHVVNTQTGAWSRFRDLEALCWVAHDDKLYFGDSGGKVHQALTGTSDNGTAITAEAQTAFSDMSKKLSRKRWTMARPVLRVDGDIPVEMGLALDYGLSPSLQSITTTTEGGAAQWNVSDWDMYYWAGTAFVRDQWEDVDGTGHRASMVLKVSTAVNDIRWYRTDFLYEPGALL